MSFSLALGLVLLLDGGGFPEAREVGPHLLGHLGEGLGLERGEVAEDRLDRFEPIDLGRAVACGERLCDQLLVELLDWQLAEPGDPGGQLLEVALLLGAGERDALGLALEAEHVDVGVPHVAFGVRVVVLDPDPEELLGLFLGPIGVGGGEVLDIGEGLLVLADLQVKLRSDGGVLGPDPFLDVREPGRVRHVLEDLGDGDRRGEIRLPHHHVLVIEVVVVEEVAVHVPLHPGSEAGRGVVLLRELGLVSQAAASRARLLVQPASAWLARALSRASTAVFWSSSDLWRKSASCG